MFKQIFTRYINNIKVITITVISNNKLIRKYIIYNIYIEEG